LFGGQVKGDARIYEGRKGGAATIENVYDDVGYSKHGILLNSEGCL
jgi:hypothetical protein